MLPVLATHEVGAGVGHLGGQDEVEEQVAAGGADGSAVVRLPGKEQACAEVKEEGHVEVITPTDQTNTQREWTAQRDFVLTAILAASAYKITSALLKSLSSNMDIAL